MHTKFLFLLGILIGLLSTTVSAQNDIWQWSAPVRNYSAQPKNPDARAYLWIPESCKKIKAVLIAQHNMEEIAILEDKGFRKRMSEMDVAEIWVCPSFNHTFDFTDGAGETLNSILSDLAQTSGYHEIESAPLIAIGHSAAASWPYYLAAYMPWRTLACISVSGQWPYFRHPSFAKDIWGNRNIDSIPCLETMGEYEAAHNWSREGLKQRKEHPYLALSMLACPAEGHFAHTPEKAQYIALYIKKALQYGHVDPTKTGWLAERWKKNEAPSYPPAPVGKYKGNPDEAFWFFDREMAEATAAYQARFRTMKPQLLGVEQNGKPVRQQNTHLQIHPSFLPEEDGITFRLTPVFLDTVPGESPRLKDWSDLPAGSPIGHASATTPVSFQIITGPAILVDTQTFQINWNRGVSALNLHTDISFVIFHPGDKTYKPAVQQGSITLPVRNKKGREQVISFAPLPNLKKGIKSISLKASSDSDLPVSYYIKEGPAYVKENQLILTPVPPRASYPVKITVVAWQYGIPGKVQTAEPVEQSFYITQ